MRTKRKAPIRCRGLCWQEPPLPQNLALADKAERAEVRREREREKERQRKRRRRDAAAVDPLPLEGTAAPAGGGPEEAPVPRLSEAELSADGFPSEFAKMLNVLGFPAPTPVQSGAWGPLLEGRDVAVKAETGSGKTLAFLAPIFHRIAQETRCGGNGAVKGVRALVVVPTRELALQIRAACRPLRAVWGFRAVSLVGGERRADQVEELRKGEAQVAVGTPGRLLDLAEGGELVLARCLALALDEADKMMQMGLREQLEGIRACLPRGPDFQTMLFSATYPSDLGVVAQEWTRPGATMVDVTKLSRKGNPVDVEVDEEDDGEGREAGGRGDEGAGEDEDEGEAVSIPPGVVQEVWVCAEHKKPRKLLKHLEAVKTEATGQRRMPRVLIFANRVKTVRFLYEFLKEKEQRVAMLHGKRSKEERDRAMRDFRGGKAHVLVATDVAARGLHIAALPHVVNYDFPPTITQYVHRVGRTGRGEGQGGRALSFFTRNLALMSADLLALLESHGQMIDPNLRRLAEAASTAAGKLEDEGGAGGASPAPPGKPTKRGMNRGLDAVDKAMRATLA